MNKVANWPSFVDRRDTRPQGVPSEAITQQNYPEDEEMMEDTIEEFYRAQETGQLIQEREKLKKEVEILKNQLEVEGEDSEGMDFEYDEDGMPLEPIEE